MTPDDTCVSSVNIARVCVLCFSGYLLVLVGCCRNEGAQTVEAELELALYLAGAMSKDNFGNPRKVSWSRSGRTDKGVHAVAQVRGRGREGGGGREWGGGGGVLSLCMAVVV